MVKECITLIAGTPGRGTTEWIWRSIGASGSGPDVSNATISVFRCIYMKLFQLPVERRLPDNQTGSDLNERDVNRYHK